jgi:hypothetical protein
MPQYKGFTATKIFLYQYIINDKNSKVKHIYRISKVFLNKKSQIMR